MVKPLRLVHDSIVRQLRGKFGNGYGDDTFTHLAVQGDLKNANQGRHLEKVGFFVQHQHKVQGHCYPTTYLFPRKQVVEMVPEVLENLFQTVGHMALVDASKFDGRRAPYVRFILDENVARFTIAFRMTTQRIYGGGPGKPVPISHTYRAYDPHAFGAIPLERQSLLHAFEQQLARDTILLVLALKKVEES